MSNTPAETSAPQTASSSVYSDDEGGCSAPRPSLNQKTPQSDADSCPDAHTDAADNLNVTDMSLEATSASGPVPDEPSNEKPAGGKEEKDNPTAYTKTPQNKQVRLLGVEAVNSPRDKALLAGQPTYDCAPDPPYKRPTTKEGKEEEAAILIAQANRIEQRLRKLERRNSGAEEA